MLGKNLPLSYFVHDPQIANAPFLGIPALGTVGSIHVDTLGMTLVSMTVILAAGAAIRPMLTTKGAGGPGQALLEGLYEFVKDITKGQIGSAYKTFFPLIAAIFIFVLIANFIGVGPWKVFESLSWWPKIDGEAFEIASPTTDFNVTFALASIALLTYVGSGFWAHGAKHLKVYFSPMVLIEAMDFIVRPATLALRLFVVITADEILRAISIALVPVICPTFVMGFELFIGLIQAFVFALLTSVYIGMTVAHH